MKVNYVDELNTFMRYARSNALTGRERLLWIALFTIANERATYNAMTKEYELPFKPVLLTGSMTAKAKKESYQQIADGSVNLVIGNPETKRADRLSAGAEKEAAGISDELPLSGDWVQNCTQ